MRKNIWKWGLFILLLAPVMTACKDDDEDDGELHGVFEGIRLKSVLDARDRWRVRFRVNDFLVRF